MVLSKEINIEAEKIEIVKDWLKLKSVYNIQVFLGFANFYWQFIQSFNRIAIPLTSILKTTRSPNKPTLNKNDSSKLASNKTTTVGQLLGETIITVRLMDLVLMEMI